MNGHPRDEIRTDLHAGRPTLSPTADPVALDVTRLSIGNELDLLFGSLDATLRASPRFIEWIATPTRYLSEFDEPTARDIEEKLRALHLTLLRRARERGWEVDDVGA
jgi:hypothetical protein